MQPAKSNISKSVIITGASRNMGLEAAIYLAQRNFRVYATMRNLADSYRVESAAKRKNLDIRVHQLDVTDERSVKKAIDDIAADCGTIYGLVNIAGIYLRGYFEDTSEEEIRQVFDTNVFGTMAVTRAVLPHMRNTRNGRIITVTSVAGRSGAVTVSGYCASRHAQEGFCESLAQEVAPFGIHVVIVEPAILKSDRWGSDHRAATGALNPDSIYYEWYKKSSKLMDKAALSSPTVAIDIVKIIHRALVRKRPKLRYMVGPRAKFFFLLRRYLPNDLFLRAYFNIVNRYVTGPKDGRV
ncbi:MAG: SDR family oxidoreductase [Desulfobacteraceae bacterium]|jgi:NAD(P)-dependent dehydrogenase (short-subunit alcohol dehydrogenase family)